MVSTSNQSVPGQHGHWLILVVFGRVYSKHLLLYIPEKSGGFYKVGPPFDS